MHAELKWHPGLSKWLLTTIPLMLLLGICTHLFSQSSHQVFEHLTTDHGLSSDKVEAIIQDRDGFYWIATQNGLNRFDGSSFTVFRSHDDDSTTLTHNHCTSLLEDGNGDIWVTTYKGVSRYIKSKGHFQRIYLHRANRNFELTNRVHALALDSESNVWIAGNGLWKYIVNKDSIISFENNPTASGSITELHLISRLENDAVNKGIWFSTGGVVEFFSTSAHQFYHAANNPLKWKLFDYAEGVEFTLDHQNRLWFRDRTTQALSYFNITTNQIVTTGKVITYGVKQIFADDRDRIWIFYWLAPAEIFDPLTNTTNTSFFSAYHRRSILSEQANSLFIDNAKNYWIASRKGISIYKEANQFYKLHELNIEDEGITKEPLKINALAQCDSQHLWIGTSFGLYKYNLVHGTFRKIYVDLPTVSITTMYSDGDILWIGAYNKVISIDTKEEIQLRSFELKPGLYFIRKDKYGDIWSGFWSAGLINISMPDGNITRFKKTTGGPDSIQSNSLINGFIDNDLVWIGYNGGVGFSSYNISSQRWAHYHPQKEDISSSNAGTVTVITKDHAGNMWLGTHGSGIFLFHTKDTTYRSFRQEDGLNSNYINSIIPDDHGHLWISTADGMNYFNTERENIQSLDMELIFPDNDYAANGLKGMNGHLYFFCRNEFVEIDPGAYRPDPAFPRMVLSSFKIFDKEYPLVDHDQTLRLTHRENFFSFEFSSIKTHPLRQVTYAYKLKGFDKDWIETSSQHFASYTNVPEGDYSFMVKATNADGQWSDPLINLPIHISPPFWRTWWFIALCILTVTSAIYGLYLMRIRQIKKIFSVRTRISQDLHDDIGGSLSSINIYSTVAEKAVSENPTKAKEFMQQININSREVMENISDIVWANQTGKKQDTSLAARIKNYGYDLLSQKNIECRYEIDPHADKKISDPEARRNILLIIKESLNNITKYSEATFAEVTVSLNGVNLLIDIKDNGKGFDKLNTRNGNGLHNMERRAELLGGAFEINSSPGKGTSIHCRIPLTNISDR